MVSIQGRLLRVETEVHRCARLAVVVGALLLRYRSRQSMTMN